MNIRAFSLVELSVVLAVISLTIGGALTLATKKTNADYEDETLMKMESIHKAIAHFVSKNARIPCPADGTDTLLDGLFGEEASCASSRFSSGTVQGGIVPVRTLNLPDDYAIDGWGQRFTYVMDDRFDDAVNFEATLSGAITIKTTEGGTDINNGPIYLLISHGRNGYGAYQRNGGGTRLAHPTISDNDEKSNSGNDLSGTFDVNFIQKSDPSTFDDFLDYRLKWHLVNTASGVTDAALCEEATSAAAACSNAVDEASCLTMGALVDKWCLTTP